MTDTLVFLFFGEVRRYKGVLDLVRSSPISRPADVVLLIAGRPGDGSIRKGLEWESGKNPGVMLELGFVSDDKFQTYMNACDVVVLPYQDILTSGAVILAMSFGRARIDCRQNGQNIREDSVARTREAACDSLSIGRWGKACWVG